MLPKTVSTRALSDLPQFRPLFQAAQQRLVCDPQASGRPANPAPFRMQRLLDQSVLLEVNCVQLPFRRWRRKQLSGRS